MSSEESKLDPVLLKWLEERELGGEAQLLNGEGINTLQDLVEVVQNASFIEFWRDVYATHNANKDVQDRWKVLWQEESAEPAKQTHEQQTEVVIEGQQQSGQKKGGICDSCQPGVSKIMEKIKQDTMEDTRHEYIGQIAKLQKDLRKEKQDLQDTQNSLHAAKKELELYQQEMKTQKQEGQTQKEASQEGSHQPASPLYSELEALEKSLKLYDQNDHPYMLKITKGDIESKKKQIHDFERQLRLKRRLKQKDEMMDDPMEVVEYVDSPTIDDLLAAHDTLKKENDMLKKENHEVRKENDSFRKENNVIKKENASFKKENASFKKERLVDGQKQRECKMNLQKKDGEIQVLNQKMTHTAVEIEKLKADNISLEDAASRVTQSEALHKKAKQKVQSKEHKIKQLEQSLKEHQGKNADLERRLIGVEREMEATKTEIQRKSHEIRQLTEELADEKEGRDVQEINIRNFFRSQSLDQMKVAQALHMEVQPLVLKQYNAFHIRSYITDIGFNEHDSMQIYKWWWSGHRENPELLEWLCASGLKLTTSASEIAYILYILKGIDDTERLQEHALSADFGDDLHHVMSFSDIQKLEENCQNIRVKVSVDDWLADLGLANDGYADKFKGMKFVYLHQLQDTPSKKLDGILRQISVKGAHKIRIKNSCLKLSSWIRDTVDVTISEEDARDVAAKFERVTLFTLWDLKQHLKQMTDDEKRTFFKKRCTSFKTRHAIKKALGLVESKSSNDRPNFGAGPSEAHSPYYGPVDGGRGHGGGRGVMGGHGHNQGYGLDQGFGGGAQFQHGGGGAGPNPGFGGGGSGGHNQYVGGYAFGGGGQKPRGGSGRGSGGETIAQRLVKCESDYATRTEAERLFGVAHIHTIQDLMSEAALQKKKPLDFAKECLGGIKVAKRVKIAKCLTSSISMK